MEAIYQGDRVAVAQDVIDVAEGRPVTCGPVGAVWRVEATEPRVDALVVTLKAVDPHEVLLTEAVYELPVPNA
jgi:hypothetical protein